MADRERRGYSRVKDEGLGLDVRGDGLELVAHTLNVSASGIYCKVGRELAPMTRLDLRLRIPSGNDAKETVTLNVSGVVVRQHPVIIDGQTKHYDIAIFFDDLSEKDRAAISDYVTRRDR